MARPEWLPSHIVDCGAERNAEHRDFWRERAIGTLRRLATDLVVWEALAPSGETPDAGLCRAVARIAAAADDLALPEGGDSRRRAKAR